MDSFFAAEEVARRARDAGRMVRAYRSDRSGGRSVRSRSRSPRRSVDARWHR